MQDIKEERHSSAELRREVLEVKVSDSQFYNRSNVTATVVTCANHQTLHVWAHIIRFCSV